MRRSQRKKDKEEESDDDGIHSDSDDDVRPKVKRSSGRSPSTGIKSPGRATRENSWNREMLTQALNESKKEVVAFNVRVPMCLALTLKHTNTTRKLILSLTAMILSAYIEYIEVSEREFARGLSLFSIFGVPRFRVYGSIDRIRAALADNVNRSRHGTTENNFRF